MTEPAPKKLRGFALLKASGRLEEVREIARRGGKSAHEQGTAHEFTSEEAHVAGRKGGAASRAKRQKQKEPQG